MLPKYIVVFHRRNVEKVSFRNGSIAPRAH